MLEKGDGCKSPLGVLNVKNLLLSCDILIRISYIYYYATRSLQAITAKASIVKWVIPLKYSFQKLKGSNFF